MKRALIVVDAQYDFMPVNESSYKKDMGGALAVPEGDKIVPVINQLIPQFEWVIFTKDWHPINSIYFADTHDKDPFTLMELNGKIDTLWPVHCVKGTRGADLHDDIKIELAKNFYIFKKGLEPNCHPYGGFGDELENTGLEEFLHEEGITDIYVSGLATDYCCKDTAIDGAKRGFNTFFILDATRGISNDLAPTLKALKENKVKIINSSCILTQ